MCANDSLRRRDAIPSLRCDNILYGLRKGGQNAGVACLSLVSMNNNDCKRARTRRSAVSGNWRDADHVIVGVEHEDAFDVSVLDLKVGFPGDVLGVIILFRVVSEAPRAMLVS